MSNSFSSFLNVGYKRTIYFIQSVWMLPIVALLIIGMSMCWFAYDGYNRTIKREFQALKFNVNLAEAEINGLVRNLEYLMIGIAREQTMLTPAQRENYDGVLAKHMSQFPEIRSLVVVNSKGKVEFTAIPKLKEFDSSKRDYFLAHLKQLGGQKLYVSRTYKTTMGSGDVGIAFSVAIYDSNKNFQGTVVTGVNPIYFESVLYKARPTEKGAIVSLTNSHGDLVYRVPNPERYKAISVASSPILKGHVNANAPMTRHIGMSVADGYKRIYILSKIGTTGLIVGVSNRYDDVLAAWLLTCVFRVVIFALMAAATLGFAWVAKRRQGERKRAEENLLKERTLFKTIIDNIPIMLTRYNPDANMLYLNNEFEKKVGWTTEEVQDIDMIEKVYPDPEYRQQAMEYMQKASAEWREFKVMSKSGETIDSEWSNIRMEDGTQIGIGIDITDRKLTEEKLIKSKNRLKRAEKIGKIGNWEYDLLNKSIVWSDHLFTLYERDPKSGPPSDDEVGKYYSEEDHKRLRSYIQQIIETGEPIEDFECPIILPSGRIIVCGSMFPIMDSSRKVIKIFGVLQDITERKKVEKEQIVLKMKLQQAQKMESIGTLAGGIAHDFNNILSSIIGFTELALDGVDEGSNVEDDLQEVRVAGMRAKDLVKQILTFARQSDEEAKPIQVNIIAKEVLKFIKSSIPTSIQIKNKIISDSLIMGSPTQIHQILMNLCTNAAQSMEENGGILEVSVNDTTIDRTAMIADLRPGEYMEIKVTDTGMGISPQDIHTIFEPYFTTKPVGEGTGMGLAVVHGIVENYGGQITVDSTIGKGTCFTIYLPITKKRKAHTPSVKEDLPFGNENILFIDDEASIAKMGSKVLEQLGYSVITRTSSVEGLELFKSKPQAFDLVISDMTMPNMTGDKLAIELMKVRSDIPVVLCTGYSKKITEENATDIGIKALVYKPVVKADLAKTVRKVLDETKSSE